MNEAEALRTHEKKIRSLAYRGTSPGVDPEDLLQEARIAFILAVRTWRGDNGACLWTLARRRIETALVRARQKAYTDRVVPDERANGLAVDRLDQGERRATPEDVAIAKQAVAALSDARRSALLSFRATSKSDDRATYLLRSGLNLLRTGYCGWGAE